MNYIDQLLKKDPKIVTEIIQKLKKYVKNRNKLMSQFDPAKHTEFSRDLKKIGGWTKGRTMKKTFSIPIEVYLANTNYWDEIIKTKQFKKHPEWMVK